MLSMPGILGPGMQGLLECAKQELTAEGVTPGRAYLVPGLQAVHDDCCENGGTLWVRVIETFPTLSGAPFPQRAARVDNCKIQAWTVRLALGIVRCTPTLDGNGNPPDVDPLTESALEMTRDRVILETAIRCCFDIEPPPGFVKTVIEGWVPVGGDDSSGGCAGGEWTIAVLMNACRCPEA